MTGLKPSSIVSREPSTTSSSSSSTARVPASADVLVPRLHYGGGCASPNGARFCGFVVGWSLQLFASLILEHVVVLPLEGGQVRSGPRFHDGLSDTFVPRLALLLWGLQDAPRNRTHLIFLQQLIHLVQEQHLGVCIA